MFLLYCVLSSGSGGTVEGEALVCLEWTMLIAGRVPGECMRLSLILESDLILLTKCYFQLSTGYILCLETR